MKLRELLKEGISELEAAGIDNAGYDARMLLQHVYGLGTSELLMQLGRDICPGALGFGEPADIIECPGDCSGVYGYRDKLALRARHIPLQHILGYTCFMGFRINVSPEVLIPRSDTEILAETVLSKETDTGIHLLDLCTGSGCIAIALKLLGRYESVVASDIEAAALDMARGNALLNGADIDFRRSDLFESIDEQFDVIVSNPPYIAGDVIPALAPEVREHDPLIALDGGADGLCFYRRIADSCRGREGSSLKPGGRLYLEIGYDQGSVVVGILEDAGFTDIAVAKDLGGLDRVVYGRKKTCSE